MYKFGKRSKEVLSELHPDLVLILEMAIAHSNMDFGLHEGARTVEKQQEYFNQGKSKINPEAYPDEITLAKSAKHIVIPDIKEFEKSRAVDLHCSVKGKTWDNVQLSYIAGLITGCANILFAAKKIKHGIRWGGDWNGNGELLTDQSFNDTPHFELIKK